MTSYYDWSDIAPEWRDQDILPVLSEGALVHHPGGAHALAALMPPYGLSSLRTEGSVDGELAPGDTRPGAVPAVEGDRPVAGIVERTLQGAHRWTSASGHEHRVVRRSPMTAAGAGTRVRLR